MAATVEIAKVTYASRDLDHDGQLNQAPPPAESSTEASPRRARQQIPYEGLGAALGGQLVRSCLVQAGEHLLTPQRGKSGEYENAMAKQYRCEFLPPRPGSGNAKLAAATPREVAPLTSRGAGTVALGVLASPSGGSTSSRDGRGIDLGLNGDGKEPEGAFLALLLADAAPASAHVLKHVETHRWSFMGAVDLASRGRGYSFFVWCLLEMQKNVQTQEEGDPLDATLTNACQSFVGTLGRRGRLADMYQVLTHFICNSVVWHEWHKFLRASFEDSRAGQEAFLVPRLDQVWGRFQRLRTALACIFGTLDDRFVWKHRLPKVSDLLMEHMRKRCFPLDLVAKNDLFLQATLKDETLKQIKFAFGFS
mmetsp:Transcript_14929/g.52412  ORF Transcript_14929/g.52412 Transcript_14929/m.52412 type:complete len:365 (-) Transcript_14929:71-1165(-)